MKRSYDFVVGFGFPERHSRGGCDRRESVVWSLRSECTRVGTSIAKILRASTSINTAHTFSYVGQGSVEFRERSRSVQSLRKQSGSRDARRAALQFAVQHDHVLPDVVCCKSG